MRQFYLIDLVSLGAISAVISVVYCMAKNHIRHSLGLEILRTFAFLVVGLAACGALLLALSRFI